LAYNVSGLILPTSIHTYQKYLNPSGDPGPLRPLSLASDQIAAGSPGISDMFMFLLFSPTFSSPYVAGIWLHHAHSSVTQDSSKSWASAK